MSVGNASITSEKLSVIYDTAFFKRQNWPSELTNSQDLGEKLD
jgi:hypothetical protein